MENRISSARRFSEPHIKEFGTIVVPSTPQGQYPFELLEDDTSGMNIKELRTMIINYVGALLLVATSVSASVYCIVQERKLEKEGPAVRAPEHPHKSHSSKKDR